MEYYCAYQERCYKEVEEKLYSFSVNLSEKEEILTDLLTFNTESTKSYEDFLDEIFNELKINEKEEREQLIKGIQAFNIPQFDKEKTVQFIRINRDFTQNG